MVQVDSSCISLRGRERFTEADEAVVSLAMHPLDSAYPTHALQVYRAGWPEEMCVGLQDSLLTEGQSTHYGSSLTFVLVCVDVYLPSSGFFF